MALYPPAWRARYGDELAALMEDAPRAWRTDWDLLKGALGMRLRAQRAWAVLAGLAAAGALAGLGVSYLVRPMWQAKAVLRYSVTDADGRTDYSPRLATFVKAWRSDAFSRQSLAGLIDDPRLDLYRDERGRMQLESVEDIMRGHLSMNVKYNTRMFTVAFVYPDARKAMDTTRALAARMIQASYAKRVSRKAAAVGVLQGGEVLQLAVTPHRAQSANRVSFAVAGAISGAVLAMGALIVRRRIVPPGPGLQHA